MAFYIQKCLWALILASLALCYPHRVYERATFIGDTTGLLAEYDYVIIGGGTSGLTVADRLTEDDDKSQDFTHPWASAAEKTIKGLTLQSNRSGH